MDATSSRRSKRFQAQPVRGRMGEAPRDPSARAPRNGERAAAHGEDAGQSQENAPPREDRAG